MIHNNVISLKRKARVEVVATAFLYGSYVLLILLFTFLPSIVVEELMHPTQTGKFFVFTYGLMGVTVLFLMHRLFSKEAFIFRIALLDILLGVLLLYITINRYFLQEVWGFSLRA